MPLTDARIRAAKPRDKPYKIADGFGMYVEIAPSGGKWWRLKYRFGGKEKRISLGVYPVVSLQDARQRRDRERKLLADGIDPGEARKAKKAVQARAETNTFEAVAREWWGKKAAAWVPAHAQNVLRRLECHIFPWIGARAVGDIGPSELLDTLQRIEGTGAPYTARRALQTCGQVFRYAITTGRADRNPAADLRGALTPTKERHHASITDPKAIGVLLRAIDGYTGTVLTTSALQLAPLVFLRPGELRRAEWAEVDLQAAEWRIPAEKMKMGEMHIVPLARQAVAVFSKLHPLTGEGKYVFPCQGKSDRPLSENTVNKALRTLGYTKDEMTGHGFRSMASTRLHEMGWNPDAIERQLAHGERNSVRAAYNYAEHLPERRKMMQAWADYLDELRGTAGEG